VRSAKRAGFTLVDVIVVLVILAILAAIAIPALTGYIDKAQDKQYIAEARNISMAIKTVLSEAYASGEINDVYYSTPHSGGTSMDAFTTGFIDNPTLEIFHIETISFYAMRQGNSNTSYDYYRRAAALIGETYLVDEASMVNERYWIYQPVAKVEEGAEDSGATAATADGFIYTLYPEGSGSGSGSGSGKPVVVVTYKITRIDESTYEDFYSDLFNTGPSTYDPTAGYEVYKYGSFHS
jgi:prepilin-type N-terminal cleavage/methylation domain-containing protein